jgi:prephenate dehydrogenase
MSAQRIAIVGPGLLGGSIALALRGRPGISTAIWARRPEAVEELKAIAIAGYAATNLARVVRDADLIVLCTPVGAMPALATEIAAAARPEAIVTDVGSVKGALVAELGAIFRGRMRFVGSHPMAGSEQTGLRAARADLFRGAVCIITPEVDSDAAAVASVGAFWESLGCLVRQLPPAVHDEAVALISHLPHLLAATLVQTVAQTNDAALGVCGPGFRDTTRVASGSPEMWAEILATNSAAVCSALDAMIEKLRGIRDTLATDPASDRLRLFLTQAKTRRDALRLPPSP